MSSKRECKPRLNKAGSVERAMLTEIQTAPTRKRHRSRFIQWHGGLLQEDCQE